ncbi:MAG: hypothetical protein ACTSU5_13920 [Promethearchaeota archaeon]
MPEPDDEKYGKKGRDDFDIDEDRCDEDHLDTLSYLIRQQFMGESDIVYGRTREVSTRVPGSGDLVNKLINILYEPLELLLSGFPDQYLERVNSEFPFNTDRVLKKYYKSKTLLDNSECTDVIIITLIVSEIISSVRTNVFQEFMDEVEVRAKKRLSSAEQYKYVPETIGKMYSKNNDHISLLYNLTFLLYLGDQYSDREVAMVVLKEILERMDLLVGEIVQEIEKNH